MNKMSGNARYIAMGAVVAAMYVALTFAANAVGLASGAIQLRLSEALTVLPAFLPAAVPGLFIGCLLANLLTGCAIWDVVLGSIATLLGAIGTRYLGKKIWSAPIFPIVANTAIVPLVLKYVYMLEDGYLFLVLTVFIGELLSCGVLGSIVYHFVDRHRKSVLKTQDAVK